MPASPNPLIELRNVTRRYGAGTAAFAALNDVSLTIAEGEFIAVIGQSGSGKTSLMNLIGLLDLPCSGKVLVRGRPARGSA